MHYTKSSARRQRVGRRTGVAPCTAALRQAAVGPRPLFLRTRCLLLQPGRRDDAVTPEAPKIGTDGPTDGEYVTDLTTDLINRNVRSDLNSRDQVLVNER